MKNFNVINVALLTVGALLIYCGVKGITPKQALQEIITGSKANLITGTGAGSDESAFENDEEGGSGHSGGGGGGGGGGSW